METIADINWKLFTLEEADIIQQLINVGNWKDMGAIIKLNDPVKEFELQRIINLLKPVSIDNSQSQVRKDLIQQTGLNIRTPEQEAEWQKKIDDEKQALADARAKQLAQDMPKVAETTGVKTQ